MRPFRKTLAAALAALCAGACFAQTGLSADATALVDSFFALRMNLSLFDGSTDAGTAEIIAAIDGFERQNAERIASLGEQERIVIDNFIIMERYNYLYEKDGQAKVQHEILGAQRERCEAFADSTPDNDLGAYFFCTWADVTSCYMGYSVSDVLKYGRKLRPLYEKALQKDADFSYALMNIAQYYYFAPKIAGGSKKTSLAYFERARAAAKTDAQIYFADIFLSQLLFENKDTARCAALLAEAESLCPGSRYLAVIRAANESGLSLYEYNRKKSALDKAAQ